VIENMGLIALFIGLPVTLVLIGLGICFVILGNKICKNNSKIPFKSVMIWLFSIPLNIVISLEAGGMYTAISTWFKNDGITIGFDLLLMPFMAFFIGTFNVIDPMKMPMGKAGAIIDTTSITQACFVISLTITTIIILYRKIKST
jgi:fumarate reductase subunit C